ncbi:hypothetical protein SLS53_005904 [Cytospora paraplurivora]|uniref:RNA-dependent RNA polymerase n=1 Tax=Cytospora paraplurivora TaxID=2898453 RepID=A0AAN9U4T8_9PEZI
MTPRDTPPASLGRASPARPNGTFRVSNSQHLSRRVPPDRHIQPRIQQLTQPHNTAVQLGSAALKDFSSITIILDRLPRDITTRAILDSLTSYQLSISRIELLEDSRGERTGKAKVVIQPPPERWPPWSGPPNVCVINRKGFSPLRVSIVSTSPFRAGLIKSPIGRYIVRQLDFAPKSLLFGMMADDTSMFNFPQYSYQKLSMLVNFSRREFEMTFTADLHPYGTQDYKLQIDFSHVKNILRATSESGDSALVILLPSPPKLYGSLPVSQDDTQSLWQEWDLWARHTDITHKKHKLKDLPAGLEKQPGECVDVGRWTTYYLGVTPATLGIWERIASNLSDYNIKTDVVTNFRLITPGPNNAWKLLDSSVESLSLEILHSAHTFHLPFEVRYQLEVCISHGLLNEYNITSNFIEKLNTFEPDRARMMLEAVAEKNLGFYDPMGIFEDPATLTYWPNVRIPSHAALVRRAVITPTTVHFKTPSVEQTNRVLRKYSDLNDHFLRVQFTDELTFGKIFSSHQDSKKNDNLYLRVHRVMSNGIVVGDRRYKFLAFSNSQFRENGAFFFCDTDHVTCDDIRNWMGDFQHIRSVGRFAARMGQCFTTTRQVSGISVPKIVPIADVQSDDRAWTFTDGVGKISTFLARMIANERDLPEVPSCYQMRMGGCKGVLVVWPSVPPSEVHIRPSQEKFKAVYNGLEIINTSSYSHAALNKQVIPILSALGVDNGVFVEMLEEELKEYADGLADSLRAGGLLRSRVDENQITLIMAEMVDTFMDTNEPFLSTLLELWKFWIFRNLKYKAAISVKQSAMVYGVVDEVGVLRGHDKNTEGRGYNRVDTLPQIFLQVPIEAWDGSLTTNYKAVTGLCVVGRNPSLHPGDVRVVQAVDVPELRHLKNVVVFPKEGDRDIPSMCSGGDLDGDDYFVFWDKRLIPTEWDHPPLDHDASSGIPMVDSTKDVSIEDVIRFFAQYMKNDSLGAIATAHFAQADQVGVKHPKCIELAKLHSKAVDYIKSGRPAVMDKYLRPKAWPHWMEKKPSYTSISAVGKIYDRMRIETETEATKWHPAYDKPFDERVLSRYQLDDKILNKAGEIKSAYDIAMRRLMGQHEAPITEFEIWSTFILSKPRVGNDYKLQENMGREVSALKERFRSMCIEAVTGVEQKQSYAFAYFTIDREKLDQFAAAMYTVTYDQVQAALRERATPQLDAEGEVVDVQVPLISFPWLFHRELARVALGREGDIRPLRRSAWAEQDRQLQRDVQDEDEVDAFSKAEAPGEIISPEEAASEAADEYDEAEAQRIYEVRSQKEGGGDGDEEIGDDYVRTSSGRIVHRGQLLDLFTENGEGAMDSHHAHEAAAITSTIIDSQPKVSNANRPPGEQTPGSPFLVASKPKHGHDGDDDEDFPEIEFEEVEAVSSGDEEDALELLAKKIAM